MTNYSESHQTKCHKELTPLSPFCKFKSHGHVEKASLMKIQFVRRPATGFTTVCHMLAAPHPGGSYDRKAEEPALHWQAGQTLTMPRRLP